MQKNAVFNLAERAKSAICQPLAAALIAIASTACATLSAPPVPLEAGQVRFRVAPAAGVPESHVDHVAREQIEAYRQREGFRSFAIVDRAWHMPGYFDYVVRFER